MIEENLYLKYEIEELESLLENPSEIETGCPLNADICLEEEIKQIKSAIKELTS